MLPGWLYLRRLIYEREPMLSDLILRAKDILIQNEPSDDALLEIENALSAYLEALATERIAEPVDLVNLEHANRLLRELRRIRSRRLAEIQTNTPPEKAPEEIKISQYNQLNSPSISPNFEEDDGYDPLKKFLISSHDPEAEALMDSAEEAFYAGNYQKAIPLFEKVLGIEPAWTRALEHREEAEEFLRSGNIPSVALPPDAGKAYGKAQSAARVFRYQVALEYLDEAFSVLKESGVNRWREGEDLRQDLENQIQAHEVFQEGMKFLDQGDLQNGLSKIQTAASAVALPEYVEKAAEIRNDLSSIEEIGDALNMGVATPSDKLAEARQKLDGLIIKYGKIPQANRLQKRIEILLPTVVASLVENIEEQIHQGSTAESLKIAKKAYIEADQALKNLRNLQPLHPSLKHLTAQVQETLSQLDVFEESLISAHQMIKVENRFYPKTAFQITKAVRAKFPHDLEVLELNRHLSWYYITFYGGIIIGVIILLALLWFGSKGVVGAVRQRQLALTPSPTITASITPTSTITLTPTITPTPEPTFTETPFLTQTPTPIVTGSALRDLFARQGCYEGYRSTGFIPKGAMMTLLALPERVFDNYNRECVLVEYRIGETNVLGYVLMMDLSFP